MDLHLPFLPVFLITIFIISLKIVFKKKKLHNPKPTETPIPPLPPGPSRLPLIGSLHHLLGSLPHRALRDLAAKHGPVMLLRLGQVDHLIVISSREAAEEVMKTHDVNFANRPPMPAINIVSYGNTGIAFSPYGSYWRQLRRICTTELLSSKRVKSFGSLREQGISRLVSEILSLAPEKPINISEKLAVLTMETLSRAAFGDKCPHQQRLVVLLAKLMKEVTGFSVADLLPSLKFVDVVTGMRFRLERIHRQLDSILEEIIREHQSESKAEDLVDVLLRLNNHDELEIPMTIDNIKAVILDMFVGGTETSPRTVEWAMAELIRNPEMMDNVQREVRGVLKGRSRVEESDVSELKFMHLVIKETLRLHPPAPLLVPRTSKESCQVQGYLIPAGSRVIVNAWALGRDPRYWEDPERFRPQRFDDSPIDFKGSNFEFIPFGAGRRICPGMAFGLAHVERVLAQLLFSFDWKLPRGMRPQDLDMTEVPGLAVSKISDLCLLATPHGSLLT